VAETIVASAGRPTAHPAADSRPAVEVDSLARQYGDLLCTLTKPSGGHARVAGFGGCPTVVTQ
jgi:hypothetical protein